MFEAPVGQQKADSQHMFPSTLEQPGSCASDLAVIRGDKAELIARGGVPVISPFLFLSTHALVFFHQHGDPQ